MADDAFPLKPFIQKPFSQIGVTTEKKIFNYRLSRASRIVENSFGILAKTFCVFMNPINLTPAKVETIVLTCCSLHNYLCSRAHSRSAYIPPESCDREDTAAHAVIPGEWQQQPQPQGMAPHHRQGSNRYSNNATEICQYLDNYFNSTDESVSWQNNMI